MEWWAASKVAGWREAGRFCGGGLVVGSLSFGAGREVTRRFRGFLAGLDGCSIDGGDGLLDGSDGRLRFSLESMSLGCLYDSLAGIARCYW